jgi:hypothetical protein
MRGRSCTSCTSAKAAVLPPGFARDQAAAAAPAALPWSPVPLPDVFSAVGYAAAQNKLAWHVFDFDRPDDGFTVPPAGPDGPTVGVLGLGFAAKAPEPPKMVSATAEMAGPSGEATYHEFKVTFAPRPPFDVLPVVLPVGDLPEGVPPQTFDVYIFSSTRSPGELPPPAGRPGGDDPFLTIGKPVPLTPAETAALAQRISVETKSPLRVQSGYRVPVTVHRDLPGRLPDIGHFERSAHFAAAGSAHTVQVQFRGRVTGLVKLEDDEKIDLGQYNSDYTTRKEVRVYTDRADLDLTLDPARSTPTFVQYTLEPAPSEGARKRWTIKVVIPAKQGRKPAWEGVVFLRAKGKDGSQATVRLPVSGNGIGR